MQRCGYITVIQKYLKFTNMVCFLINIVSMLRIGRQYVILCNDIIHDDAMMSLVQCNRIGEFVFQVKDSAQKIQVLEVCKMFFHLTARGGFDWPHLCAIGVQLCMYDWIRRVNKGRQLLHACVVLNVLSRACRPVSERWLKTSAASVHAWTVCPAVVHWQSPSLRWAIYWTLWTTG